MQDINSSFDELLEKRRDRVMLIYTTNTQLLRFLKCAHWLQVNKTIKLQFLQTKNNNKIKYYIKYFEKKNINIKNVNNNYTNNILNKQNHLFIIIKNLK